MYSSSSSSSSSKAVESHCSSLDSVLAVMNASCRRQTHFTGKPIQALKRGTALCHRASTYYVQSELAAGKYLVRKITHTGTESSLCQECMLMLYVTAKS